MLRGVGFLAMLWAAFAAATPGQAETRSAQTTEQVDAHLALGLAPDHLDRKLAECKRGQLDGCTDAAGHFHRGDIVKADAARAAALFTKACDGGHGPACSALGTAKAEAKDAVAALALYERACLAGSGSGCYGIYVIRQSSPGQKIDPTESDRLLRLSCELNYSRGCTVHGQFLLLNRRDLAGFEEAGRQFDRACTLGDGMGCGELADRIANNPRRVDELPDALVLYQRGCALGNAEACSDGEYVQQRIEALAKGR